MIQLHYFPGNASMTTHLLLRELGVPFELQYVDRAAGAHKSAEYLKLNPNGLIPVLVDGDLVLYETAAIVLHLVDTHPGAGLAPTVLGSAERALFYKWIVWLAGSVMPMMQHYFYGERMVAPGDAPAAAEVKTQAEARLNALFDQIEAQFAGHGGPWFLGDRFSALDPYVFMFCRWSRGFARPARALPHISPFLARMLARPAVQKVFEVEQLAAPLV
jgi:glutathione S-transferase